MPPAPSGLGISAVQHRLSRLELHAFRRANEVIAARARRHDVTAGGVERSYPSGEHSSDASVASFRMSMEIRSRPAAVPERATAIARRISSRDGGHMRPAYTSALMEPDRGEYTLSHHSGRHPVQRAS